MKSAFIAYTPLHILNVITFVFTNEIDDADLYVICMFRPYDDMMVRIKNLGLFSNVYVADSNRLQKNEKFWTLIGMSNPQGLVKHLFGTSGVKRKDYTNIYFSYPTSFVDNFTNMFKGAHVYAYDDGLGSYVGDLFKEKLGGKYALFQSIFGVKRRYPECLYLNNEEFSVASRDCMTMPLKRRELTSNELQRIYSVFGFSETDDYKKYRFIYLNRPHSDAKDVEGYKNDERKILDELSSSQTIIRLHPRESNLSFYDGFTFDENKGWELLCMNCISDSNILISGYSTAQFTPKMFYNKEPYIIFIYKLIDDLLVNEDMELMIERLKTSYNDSNKIKIPSTLDEFKLIVEQLGNG